MWTGNLVKATCWSRLVIIWDWTSERGRRGQGEEDDEEEEDEVAVVGSASVALVEGSELSSSGGGVGRYSFCPFPSFPEVEVVPCALDSVASLSTIASCTA